jgi:UDP-N-acetylglucosamine 4,6-dehydratase
MAEAFKADADRMRFFLGDVRDTQRMQQAFTHCDEVVHAAALKRVQESVYSPSELIKTNIIGTMNVIAAATAAKVSRVLLISSDKAVEATNLYGKTKACAEDYAVQANSYSYPVGTRVSAVRYGNVLNSRGSVLGIWADQVAKGQPITITDYRMTRFIISLRQATELVQYALLHMEGGEIYVPLLPSAHVHELAEVMYPNYPKRLTGIRPGGEKLHEDLLSREEVSRINALDGLFLVRPTFRSWATESYPGKNYTMAHYRSGDGPLERPELRALLAYEGIAMDLKSSPEGSQGPLDAFKEDPGYLR